MQKVVHLLPRARDVDDLQRLFQEQQIHAYEHSLANGKRVLIFSIANVVSGLLAAANPEGDWTVTLVTFSLLCAGLVTHHGYKTGATQVSEDVNNVVELLLNGRRMK